MSSFCSRTMPSSAISVHKALASSLDSSVIVPLPVTRSSMVLMGPKATRLSMMPKASSTARPDWARTMNLVGLASFLLTAIAISTIMAAATTTPKKMSCGMQLLTTSATSSRLTPMFARVRSRVFIVFLLLLCRPPDGG